MSMQPKPSEHDTPAVPEVSSSSTIWPGLSGADDAGPFLHGSRCGHCGHVMLGRRGHCSRCWAVDGIDSISLGRRGQVYSKTVIHAAPAGFAAPYTVGYVDIEEGIRVFAHLESGTEGPHIGDEVALDVTVLRRLEGEDLTGPVYRRAKRGST